LSANAGIKPPLPKNIGCDVKQGKKRRKQRGTLRRTNKGNSEKKAGLSLFGRGRPYFPGKVSQKGDGSSHGGSPAVGRRYGRTVVTIRGKGPLTALRRTPRTYPEGGKLFRGEKQKVSYALSLKRRAHRRQASARRKIKTCKRRSPGLQVTSKRKYTTHEERYSFERQRGVLACFLS